jgi:hypothetical protein
MAVATAAATLGLVQIMGAAPAQAQAFVPVSSGSFFGCDPFFGCNTGFAPGFTSFSPRFTSFSPFGFSPFGFFGPGAFAEGGFGGDVRGGNGGRGGNGFMPICNQNTNGVPDADPVVYCPAGGAGGDAGDGGVSFGGDGGLAFDF